MKHRKTCPVAPWRWGQTAGFVWITWAGQVGDSRSTTSITTSVSTSSTDSNTISVNTSSTDSDTTAISSTALRQHTVGHREGMGLSDCFPYFTDLLSWFLPTPVFG